MPTKDERLDRSISDMVSSGIGEWDFWFVG